MASEISLINFSIKAKELALFLFSKKWSIVIVSFIFSVIGIIYAWTSEPIYSAQLTFVAESEKSGIGGYASLAAQFGFDLGGGSNNAFGGDNLTELLKSRSLVDMTLLTSYENSGQLFIDQYIINHHLNKNWGKDTSLSKVKFSLGQKDINILRDSIFNNICENIIKNKLDIDKLDKKSDIVYIKMIDNNQYFAKKFVETLANNAIIYYTAYKTKKNLANVNIIQHQADSVRAMLFGNISDVATINDLNINPSKQTLRTSGQKKQVDLQVNATLYTELLKNLELAKLSLRKETPLIQVVDRPHLPLKNEKTGRLLMGIIFGLLGFIISSLYFIFRNEIQLEMNSKGDY